MLEDADGQSLLEIFRNTNTRYPHEFLLPKYRKRNPHSLRDRFLGTPHAEPMPTCFNMTNHSGNHRKKEYFNIELPPHPFAEEINKSVHHIWNEHPNAHFFRTWYIILAYLWLYMVHQILTFTFLIFNRWKEKLKRRFSARSDRPLSLKVWKQYCKFKQHGKKQIGRTH